MVTKKIDKIMQNNQVKNKKVHISILFFLLFLFTFVEANKISDFINNFKAKIQSTINRIDYDKLPTLKQSSTGIGILFLLCGLYNKLSFDEKRQKVYIIVRDGKCSMPYITLPKLNKEIDLYYLYSLNSDELESKYIKNKTYNTIATNSLISFGSLLTVFGYLLKN